MTMEVKLVESDADLEKLTGVLLQLRSGFDKDDLIVQIKEQRKRGYELAYVESDGMVFCVAGFVIAVKLAWGRHIYIDDFVTGEGYRRSGAGAHLIEWFKAYARKHGCQQIHLDSGVTNVVAHSFYLRQGFNIASHHFSIKGLLG